MKISNKGFTLVEMLVVMVVFGVVGAIATAILVTSLRTSTKTNVVINVKQNGNFALEQVSKILREARFLRNPFPCGTTASPTLSESVDVVTSDGLPITLSCDQCDASGACSVANNIDPTISSNSASLIDTTSLSLKSCQFTCTQASISDYPVVSLQFSLTSKASGTFAEQQASASAVMFSSSISLRNINR